MPELHAQIYGEVFAVGFRFATARWAQELGITGWVRNRKGAGHVEVIAQGSRENLEKFLLLIRRGPQFAKVRKVQVEWRQGVEEFKHFRIIKD